MGWFGGRSAKGPGPSEAAIPAIGDLAGPTAILQALEEAVPLYIGKADRGDLIYPACQRTPTDADGNVRSIWEHTRIEAMRYVMLVPRREVDLLVDPARQPEMLEAYLRRPPHDDTVVDFTGVAIDDFAIAITAGLNWLNHCAVLTGVDRDKFSGTLRNFRKIVVIAQRWWALEGSGPRCHEMLVRHEKPPLMLYLTWLEYTRLAKEIAIAVTHRSSESKAAPEAVAETMARLESARDPDDLASS
jgi:hypothetical protein